MNRIVRDHYRVAKLPEDLDGQADVRVAIDAPAATPPSEDGSTEAMARRDQFSRFHNVRRANSASMDEVVDYVRRLRDKWTDRE